MTAERDRLIEVWADWEPLKQATKVGILHARFVRGREIFSFSHEWLGIAEPQAIDPQLVATQGEQYANDPHELFGVFLDSAPDRWGRLLMGKRERLEARRENRQAQTLFESDYLLGVHDQQRIGGLRFREPYGPFLDNRDAFTAPPLARIRELEIASQRVQRDDADDDPEHVRWLQVLLAPGSSLGGSRPKASVIDPSGNLWIAKFPSRLDTYDHGAWEFVAHELASHAGIAVPEARCERFTSEHSTFLVQRFDRTAEGRRLHFASALALLRHRDREEASYLELSHFLLRSGSSANHDLEQLWRRIAFSVCVSNVDDHLRNHGFILADGGWRLSPAYDINTSPAPRGLTVLISESDNSQDLDLVRSVAPQFRIADARAQQIIVEVVQAVNDWRSVAASAGLSRSAQQTMERAFVVAEMHRQKFVVTSSPAKPSTTPMPTADRTKRPKRKQRRSRKDELLFGDVQFNCVKCGLPIGFKSALEREGKGRVCAKCVHE